MANPFVETYLNEASKLDGSKYVNWKFNLQTMMKGYDSWTITKGEEAKLVASLTTASIQDLEKRENKKKVLLKMCVKDNIIPYIHHGQSSTLTMRGDCAMEYYSLVNSIMLTA